MNPRSIVLLCAIFLSSDAFTELSPHSCSLLRNIGSLTRIVPELSELAMRFYRPTTTTNQRVKRSTKEQNQQIKGTMIEQLIANTIRDVNFTNVALLILSSNETKSKIERNVDFDLIIRSFIRSLDHEKLSHAMLKSVQSNFDLEHLIESSINHTQMSAIHDQLLHGEQLPEWLLTSIHPNLTNSVVRRMKSTIQNLTEKFIKIFSKFERVDSFMFNILMQQTLIPMNHVVERVKERKPKNFDQLLETMINTTKQILTVRKFHLLL